MKLATENSEATTAEKFEIHLPFGLIGLPQLKKFEITPIEGSWPFMTMRAINEERFDFIVIEPFGLIPGYELELSDDDAAALQIGCAYDALVLTIVTVHSLRPQHLTVNLVGPVVLNRESLTGKQVIGVNSDSYSTHHVLIDDRRAEARQGRRAAC